MSGLVRGRVGLIWAQTPTGVIGADGGIPWQIREDLRHFKRITLGHPVVMGRSTWESLAPRFRPLPGRRNLVLSRRPGWRAEGAEAFASLTGALQAAADEDVWVIGGGQVYESALPVADAVERTLVGLEVKGDTRAPRLDPQQWRLVEGVYPSAWQEARTGEQYRFERWERMRR